MYMVLRKLILIICDKCKLCNTRGGKKEKNVLMVYTCLPFDMSLSMAAITGSPGRCRFSVQNNVPLLRDVVQRKLFNGY
jgi:hypothetical protein